MKHHTPFFLGAVLVLPLCLSDAETGSKTTFLCSGTSKPDLTYFLVFWTIGGKDCRQCVFRLAVSLRTMTYTLGTEVKGHNGTAMFDGHFLHITRKGVLASVSVGKGNKSIPIGSVTAVQWKEPGAMVNGFIQFSLTGGNELRSKFGKQTINAVGDENSIILRKGKSEEMAELRTAVMEAIRNRDLPQTAVVNQSSTADEILKLVALRDAGALSNEEFEAQKARLLQ